MDEINRSDVEEQATRIAQRTSVTFSQAFAYLLWIRTDEETEKQELAREMNIDQSTFSNHLSEAEDALDADSKQMSVDELSRYVLSTDVGGENSILRRVVAGTETGGVTVVLTEYAFSDLDDVSNYPYRLHIQYQKVPGQDYMDEMPESMHLPDRWEIISVGGETVDDLVDYIASIMDREDIRMHAQSGVMHLLSMYGADISDWEREKFP